jgi:hypothetical protein
LVTGVVTSIVGFSRVVIARIVIAAGLALVVDGIENTFSAISSTLSFHALFRGLGYDICLFSSVK